MTFFDLDGAQMECQFEREQSDAATSDMKSAFQQLEQARAALESERSFWDGSTLATVGGLITIGVSVAACVAPEPVVTKTICAATITAGALGVTASEVDRFSDISSAEAALQQAETLYDMASREATRAQMEFGSCIWHHLAKPSTN
jgi:hypothetical protein